MAEMFEAHQSQSHWLKFLCLPVNWIYLVLAYATNGCNLVIFVDMSSVLVGISLFTFMSKP